jgi:hypothetical protein
VAAVIPASDRPSGVVHGRLESLEATKTKEDDAAARAVQNDLSARSPPTEQRLAIKRGLQPVVDIYNQL